MSCKQDKLGGRPLLMVSVGLLLIPCFPLLWFTLLYPLVIMLWIGVVYSIVAVGARPSLVIMLWIGVVYSIVVVGAREFIMFAMLPSSIVLRYHDMDLYCCWWRHR